MTLAGVPARYRSLLVTFSPMWRRLHGEVTLTTLLELHAARGQRRPSFSDRVSFAVAGLESRLPRRLPSGPRAVRADSASAPGDLPLVRGGFLLASALGADAPVTASPATTTVLSLVEAARRRRAAAWRLAIEAVVLATAVALLLWSPRVPVLLVTAGATVALAAAAFDLVLLVRLGRRILAEP